MRRTTQLRLIGLACGLSLLFVIFSTAVTLLNFPVIEVEPLTGAITNVTMFSAGDRYREHLFGLAPQYGMALGVIAAVGFATLYGFVEKRTNPMEIVRARAAAEIWLQQHWWQVAITVVLLAGLMTAGLIRWLGL